MTTPITKRGYMPAGVALTEVTPNNGCLGCISEVCKSNEGCVNYFIGMDASKAFYCEKVCIPVIAGMWKDRQEIIVTKDKTGVNSLSQRIKQ